MCPRLSIVSSVAKPGGSVAISKQHAAGFAEINGVKILAVDNRRDVVFGALSAILRQRTCSPFVAVRHAT